LILTLHQPQYLPWLGYFDKVRSADLFVALDLPQFEKNDWQNRNRVKGAQGPLWLTVPVLSKGRSAQAIRDVEINPREGWQRKHWATLELNYRRAPYWELYAPKLKPYFERPFTHLAGLNLELFRLLALELGVSTPLKVESELGSEGSSTERLIDLCRRCGADAYLAGAGGAEYMDSALFAKAGLRLLTQHYQHPEYRQQHQKIGFLPYLSAVDLLFNEGPGAAAILPGTRLDAA
jgi:hypothetical protein